MPRCIGSDHGIEDDQHLVHARGNGHVVMLSCLDQSFIQIANHRIATHGGDRGHVQRGSGRGAPAADMARALAGFPGLGRLAMTLLAVWSEGICRFALGSVNVDIIVGDARDTLRLWDQQADAWYLDGFSPAKNPELWEETLLCEVARHTAANGTFATYSAAGFVRRGLQSAGFRVERAAGYGHKHHMSRGVLDISE